MQKIITIALITTMMLGTIPIHAGGAPATGVRGSINRTWEAGKVLLGALLLIPGFFFGIDGSLQVRHAFQSSQNGSTAGLALGAGISSLIVGTALMESGLRNLREARRRHKK